MSKNERSILEFEKLCKSLLHVRCSVCRRVGISLRVSAAGVCGFCVSKKSNSIQSPYSLPVWYDDDGVCHYELPHELQDLRIGEQMVIQRLSLYVPIQYLRFGQTCCTGHVCAFPQDVQQLCDVLPRLPHQVTRVRVVKYVSLPGDNATGTKCFSVRKDKVLTALRWLKKYNKEYQNIVIEERNLDWIGGASELELPVEGDSFDKSVDLREVDVVGEAPDLGPSPVLNDVSAAVGDSESYGFFPKDSVVTPVFGQSSVCDSIRTALVEGNEKNKVCFFVLSFLFCLFYLFSLVFYLS